MFYGEVTTWCGDELKVQLWIAIISASASIIVGLTWLWYLVWLGEEVPF